mmetsp:Transcript_22367/g.37411  ORF Transcript_22367/g.37411 Transcript_22367/m.37411 type:complete len:100 (+) Transcript_22367:1007-1306(+)
MRSNDLIITNRICCCSNSRKYFTTKTTGTETIPTNPSSNSAINTSDDDDDTLRQQRLNECSVLSAENKDNDGVRISIDELHRMYIGMFETAIEMSIDIK